MERIPITEAGFLKLEAELKRLKSEERPAVIRAIAEARSHGDLSENAEYDAARERQSFIEGRVAELEDVVRRAQVIDPSTMTGSVIRFGAKVILADADTDTEVRYQIVGTHEANIATGFLSVTSPLGRALMGKTVGDAVEVTTPNGSKSYEVVEVKYG